MAAKIYKNKITMNPIKFSLLAILFFSLGCQSKPSKKNGSQSVNQPVELPIQTFQHFRLLESKVEKKGENVNTMELYYILDKYDLEELRRLCLYKKESFRDGFFLFVVIFDKKENAMFPSTPFTAEFGTDDEIMKHIKALYTYNSTNGYSMLAIYDKNMLQSVVKEIKI